LARTRRGYGPRALRLDGLGTRSALLLLKRYGVLGVSGERAEFVRRYNGNPLALHLAAELVEDLFGGRIGSFLRSDVSTVGGIAQLLEAHFVAISDLQRRILTRLATAREPLSFQGVVEDTFLERARVEAASAMQELLRRSLVERRSDQFFLQYLIQEYALAHFAESASAGVAAGLPSVLADFPLVDTRRPVHIRDAQRDLTVRLVRDSLLRRLGGRRPIVAQLRGILDLARYQQRSYGSFVAANVLELCRAMGEEMSQMDFSATRLRNVDLSDYPLHSVNMSHCEFDRCRFASAHEHIFGMALAGSGQFAVIGHLGGAIAIIDVPTGRIVRSFDWDAVWLRAIALSPDDKVLAATDDRGRVRIVHLETGRTVDIPGNGRQIRSLAFSADGQLLFSGGEEGLVRQIDPEASPDARVLLEAGSEVWGLACDLDLLAIATSADGLKLLDLGSVSEWPVEPNTSAPGRSVAISGGGDWVFVGCEDGSVRVWTRTGGVVGEIGGHSGPIWTVAVATVNRSQLLFSGSHDGSVRVVDVSTPARPELRGVLINDEGPVWPLMVDRNGSVLAAVTGSATVRFWDPRTLEPVERLRGGFRRTFTVASNDDHTLVATGGQDGTLRLWDPAVRHCRKELPGHRGGVRALAFSPSGQLVASAGEDWDVRVWDVTRAELRTVLEGPSNWVWCLAFDPSGHRIAAGSADLKIHVWDLQGRFSSRRLEGHSARVVGLTYSATGSHLISSSVDGEIWLWNATTGQGESVARLSGGATCLTYLGDLRVAVGDRTGSVTILDLARPQDAGVRIQVHRSQVLCLEFVPGPAALVSGGEDGTLTRVNARTGGVERTASLGADPIRAVALVSRGTELVAARGSESLSVVSIEALRLSRSSTIPRQYEGLQLAGARGLTHGQLETLISLGAVEQIGDPSPGRAGLELDAQFPPASIASPHATIFVSYSHEDSVHMRELRKHLAPLEAAARAEVWVDSMIGAGREWDAEIDSRLEVADIVLLLLSADYLASTYCQREMERAIERADRGETRVAPIIVRHCDWQHLPVGRFQSLPDGGVPIAGSPDLDEVRTQVSLGVRGIVDWVLTSRGRR
jgi:WD40 repeat protein